MGIEDTIAWYQKKIGTYDKQPWEKSVEQRILPGLSHIELKKGKPKTELIDLDLVRGSSFTKAKPKHGFIKVARLSVLRVIFLPLCSKWWVQQTSGKIFGILLLVYLLQLYNVATYTCHTAHLQDDESHNVPRSEIIVPMIMMLMLCFIHSQIEATNPLGAKKIERKYSCKSYRRVRRHHRKVTVEKAEGDAAKKAPADKESLNHVDRSNKNVLFEENDVIIPNKEANEDVEQNNLDVANENRRPNRLPFDDDGFESLNGNGSSPSDNGEERVVPSKASLNGIRCHEWVKEVRDTRKMPFLTRRQSVPNLRFSSGELESDSDTSIDFEKERRNSQIPLLSKKTQVECVCESDDEHEIDNLSAQETVASGQIDASASGTEWMAVTTNSEDCSYSSELSESDTQFDNIEADAPPTSILRYSDRVSCTIWKRREIKKADLSVFDISSMIIARVEQMPESMNYFYIGLFTSTMLASLPILCRFCYTAIDSSNLDELQLSLFEITQLVFGTFSGTTEHILEAMLGNKIWERSVMVIAAFQRLVLGVLLFFLLTIAERTFKQRFLYAKLFSHLTSSRRAKKSDLPHFRLNKVRNIKTWLSVRSYLKKRGPQRSVDVIVSAAFIVTLLLLSFLCMELLKESFVLNSQYNLEIMIWSIGLGIMILRFMTLGVKINKKYRNLSILITEQINLYLQIEQKPHKKDELMVANNVLKLAADLLKELESQFKILGLCANPFLYNITKVVILSALSGVLSEILGFKLKLHKIKIK